MMDTTDKSRITEAQKACRLTLGLLDRLACADTIPALSEGLTLEEVAEKWETLVQGLVLEEDCRVSLIFCQTGWVCSISDPCMAVGLGKGGTTKEEAIRAALLAWKQKRDAMMAAPIGRSIKQRGGGWEE
jgi:hypothetical protein